METVLITGGTGLTGTAVSGLLKKNGYKVIIISRGQTKDGFAHWDPEKKVIDRDIFSKADHIIHLAGAGIADKRWTSRRKLEILNSRVKSGQLLVSAIQEYPNKIKSVITASAIGWYGPDPAIPNPSPFTEDKPVYPDFLGQTCKLWEAATEPVTASGIRHVKFRTGIVLSGNGGALKEFLKPLRFRMATVLGTGKQMISWIHIDDLARIYLKAIQDETMHGVYNAVSPEPVSNDKFVTTLAVIKNGNGYFKLRIPAFILRLILGEMSIEVLKSATVSCDRVKKAGYNFLYPDINSALNEV